MILGITSQLKYYPDSGLFYWVAPYFNNQVKIGHVAGNVGNDGYIRIRYRGKAYLAHRLAFLFMEGEMPCDLVDHVNRNPSDNRWINLRHASQIENQKNKGVQANNSSGVPGVSWDKRRKRWHSRITVQRKNIHLLYTDDYFEACCARKSAELREGFHQNHGMFVGSVQCITSNGTMRMERD